MATATTCPAVRYHIVNVDEVDHTDVEGNVNNGNSADFHIDLVGHIAWTASNFVGVV